MLIFYNFGRCGDCTMFLVTDEMSRGDSGAQWRNKRSFPDLKFLQLNILFSKELYIRESDSFWQKMLYLRISMGWNFVVFFLIIGPSSAGQRRTQKPANNSANQRFFRLATISVTGRKNRWLAERYDVKRVTTLIMRLRKAVPSFKYFKMADGYRLY